MAAIKQLAAVTRSGIGKGASRSVRRDGRVPGVVYGGGEKAEPISVDFKDLHKLIYSGHFLTTIFELDVEGRKQRVLPRDYQLDVVSDTPLHVDFFRLKAGSRVRIAVHHPSIDRELIDQAVVTFYRLRELPKIRKRPTTSELIDWIAVLKSAGIGKERFVKEPPFLGVLLKKEQDIDTLGAAKKSGAWKN